MVGGSVKDNTSKNSHGGSSTRDPFSNRGSDAYSTLFFKILLHESALQSHKGVGSYTTECALQDASHRYGNKIL